MGIHDNEHDELERCIQWVQSECDSHVETLSDDTFLGLTLLNIQCLSDLETVADKLTSDELSMLRPAYRKWDYVQSDGGSGYICPYCDGEPDDDVDPMMDLTIHRNCKACGNSWQEHYELVGVTDE